MENWQIPLINHHYKSEITLNFTMKFKDHFHANISVEDHVHTPLCTKSNQGKFSEKEVTLIMSKLSLIT